MPRAAGAVLPAEVYPSEKYRGEKVRKYNRKSTVFKSLFAVFPRFFVSPAVSSQLNFFKMPDTPSTQASYADVVNAIRALAMDAVQQANSGHPGMPMGMAEIAEVLWRRFLRHNPANPAWPDRDRFVLSNGHGSMLQYALLHLTGYDLPMEEIRKFRQLHSQTPGHPEVGPHARRGDDHRPARAGPGQRRGLRARRAPARRAVQPARAHGGRPFHLRLRGRRLPHGRHLPRGVLARGRARPRASSSPSTTTTASPSTARSRAGSATTRPCASPPTAGT